MRHIRHMRHAKADGDFEHRVVSVPGHYHRLIDTAESRLRLDREF